MNWIFRGFCINRFGIGPLNYISSRSDFGFEFSEIFVFEKRLPDSRIRGVRDSPYQRYAELATLRLNDTGSRRLSASLIRRVDDSPHHWYAESTTPCITDMESWLLNFLKENLLYPWYGDRVSVMRRVVDSPYRWVGESPTRIVDTESRRLPVSLSRESLVEKKISLALIFSTLNSSSMSLKD